ncbi:MAG: N-acetylmuramic acid 6-phosphate etherase [Eubacteriales bacterium]|nr:N-acetylmuramic acid 6-phosphate etherase [Eubacteriales bacterium]
MLKTEMRNPRTMHIDRMSTPDMVGVITDEFYESVRAVERERESIARAVDCIAAAIARGGRLFFIGAGTSGRLGVLDAAECPPTFGVSPSLVVGIIAGGPQCMFTASENAEDGEEAGRRDIRENNVCEKDVVVGISVAGGAAYVVGALNEAKKAGAVAVALSCNRGSAIERESDLCICTETGAEAITGSTRMKAGTAHKMVLNILTTCAMIKNGNVYENLMINLRPTNIKLRARVVRITQEICGCGEEEALALLEQNEWSIRRAAEQAKANRKDEG